jgi:hypothetical protein
VQYALLIYGSGEGWGNLSQEEQEKQLGEYRALSERSETRGGADLGDLASATTVRVNDGEAVLSDGPFADTKEWLAGYYVLDCPDLDSATKYAARIPAARHGAIEVRPVMAIPGM